MPPCALPRPSALRQTPTMTTESTVTITGKLIIHAESATTALRCPVCDSTTDHRVTGHLGDRLTVTCRSGHDVQLPDEVNHAALWMDIANDPGVSVALPE